MPRKPKAPRLVLVRWDDAAGQREDEGLKPIPCLSVGWCIEVNDDYIKLASELIVDDTDGDYQEVVVIPKGMIRQIVVKPFKLPEPFDTWGPKAAK